MMNQDLLDAVAVLSFVVGLANYQENLTQSDKAELMDKLDRQTKDILERVEQAVEEQNKMLREILIMAREKKTKAAKKTYAVCPEQFAERMKEIAADDDDPEMNHAIADGLMCETLEALGFGEGVETFNGMRKWYS